MGAPTYFTLVFALCALQEAEDRHVDIELRTRTLRIDATLDDALIKSLRATGATRPVHAFLWLRDRLSIEDHRALTEQGVKLLGWAASGVYEASIEPGPDAPAPAVRELITGGALIEPADKVHPALGRSIARARSDGLTSLELLLTFHPDITLEYAQQTLAGQGLRGVLEAPPRVFRVDVPIESIERIAALDSIRLIDPLPVFDEPMNDLARSATGADLAQQASYSSFAPLKTTYAGVSGDGVRVGVCDGGIDEFHPDFSNLKSTTSRFYVSSPLKPRNHPTHAASVIAGNGSMSMGIYRGQAPEALLADYPAFFSQQTKKFHNAINVDGTHVTWHYTGQSSGDYTPIVAGLDMIVAGQAFEGWTPIPPRPALFPSGNQAKRKGYYSSRSPGKNTLAVGSIDATTGLLSKTSGIGPTLDGRLKPDLVAPGRRSAAKGVMAAYSQSLGYIFAPGT